MRKCEICGKEITEKDRHKKCPACRKLIQQGKEPAIHRRTYKKKKSTLTCGHENCKYAVKCAWVKSSKLVTCDYILIEGHSRPSLPTPECSCFEKRKRGRKNEHTLEKND